MKKFHRNGDTFRNGEEIQCLPYAGFCLLKLLELRKSRNSDK